MPIILTRSLRRCARRLIGPEEPVAVLLLVPFVVEPLLSVAPDIGPAVGPLLPFVNAGVFTEASIFGFLHNFTMWWGPAGSAGYFVAVAAVVFVDTFIIPYGDLTEDDAAGIERGATLAMRHADVAVVVTNPEVSSVRDSDRIIGLLDSKTLKAERGERMEKHLLLTRYDASRAERGDNRTIHDQMREPSAMKK